MTGPGAIGSLELGMTVHLFGGSHDGENLPIPRAQIGAPLRAARNDGDPFAALHAGGPLPTETYHPVTLHPLLPAWLRARWLAYAVPEATREVRDGSLVVWVLAHLASWYVISWQRGPS